jgi:uncharacterized protein (TIGR03067 family)
MNLRVFGLLALVCSLPSPRGEACVNDAVNPLLGNWRPVKMERGGEVVKDAFLPDARFVVSGDALQLVVGEKKHREYRIRVNPAATPPAIDLTPLVGPGAGSPFRGIYRLEGKRLTLCWQLGKDQQRPKAFGGDGQDLATLTLERE